MSAPKGPAQVLTERTGERGRVLLLTLNRPDRLNAVSLPLYEALVDHLERGGGDREVRCIVLTGQGRAFCAGADLKAHADGPMSEEDRARYVGLAQRANELIQTISIPVIAAVNGHAIGAGLELALSADFTLVAEDAKLRLPEIALGTFVGGGVVYTLVERVGILRAKELVYLGDFFSGADAEEMGLANRALAAPEVLPKAMEWAERLAAQAPLSMAAAKALIGPATRRSPAEARESEREALERIFRSSDWREGLAAFHEGRPPSYRGE